MLFLGHPGYLETIEEFHVSMAIAFPSLTDLPDLRTQVLKITVLDIIKYSCSNFFGTVNARK